MNVDDDSLKFIDLPVFLKESSIIQEWMQGLNKQHQERLAKLVELVNTLEEHEKTGDAIIFKALEAPLFTISQNAGLEGSVIVNKVRESEPGTGFDALHGEYVKMVDAGILDPAKVTRSDLQNATSVASTLLTTESVVANIKEDVPPMPCIVLCVRYYLNLNNR